MLDDIGKKSRCYYDAGARIIVIAFSLLLAIPAIGTLFVEDGALRSQWENRPMAKLPSLFDSGFNLEFFSDLDRYLNDNYGFALEFNRIHRMLLFYVFHDTPSSDISLGKDGYVFLTSYKSKPFSAIERICLDGVDPGKAVSSAEAWLKLMDYYKDKYKNVGIVIVPTKPTLYPEKLTSTVPQRYREACAQYDYQKSISGVIANRVREKGYVSIYPYKEFTRQRYDGNFYPRENFHYSGASAHWLGGEILRQMGISTNHAYDEKMHDTVVTNDLRPLLGFERSIEMFVYPYTSFSIKKNQRTPSYVKDYFKRARDYSTYYSENPLSGRSALLIGNSFTPFTAEHLAPGYQRLSYIQTNPLQQDEYVKFFTELVPRFQADDLIFVLNDIGAADRAIMWVDELRKDKIIN